MFSKYAKMKLDVAPAGASSRGNWIATEKVHGANFSVIVSSAGDGATTTVAFAKRTAILAPTDDFYGFRSQGLADDLAPRARRLFAALRRGAAGAPTSTADSSNPPLQHRVQIYGELYGGHYPHPDVPAVRGLLPVQRGVWYSPGLAFLAFDVAADGAYLDYARARAACGAADLAFAAPLARGTLPEVLARAPVRFASTVAGTLHGLPPLPLEGGENKNWAEGVVIRCVDPGRRALFKRKIPEFGEVAAYRNDAWKAAKGGGGAGGGGAGGGGETPAARRRRAEELATYEALARVTPQRLAPVIDFAEHFHASLGAESGEHRPAQGPSARDPEIRSQRLCS